MGKELKNGSGTSNAPGQNKEYAIVVNSRNKVWTEKLISYEQVVVLAFGEISKDKNVIYTVTFTKGANDRPNGTLVKGDSVNVKNEMKFNVTQTNRS